MVESSTGGEAGVIPADWEAHFSRSIIHIREWDFLFEMLTCSPEMFEAENGVLFIFNGLQGWGLAVRIATLDAVGGRTVAVISGAVTVLVSVSIARMVASSGAHLHSTGGLIVVSTSKEGEIIIYAVSA